MDVLIHPSHTPSSFGIGWGLFGGTSAIFALSPCCQEPLSKDDKDPGRWRCNSCARAWLRATPIYHTVQLTDSPDHRDEQVETVRRWASEWTGYPEDRLSIEIK